MELAKKHVDLGLFATNIDSDLSFWQSTVGLKFDHSLQLEAPLVPAATTQHRHDANGSVIKVNHFHDRFIHSLDEPSGYRGITIAKNLDKEVRYTTSSKEFVRVIPKGTDQIEGIAITVVSNNTSRLKDYYTKVLGLKSAGSNTVRCGDSLLFLEKGVGGNPTSTFVGEGFRYLTIQVFDADKTCSEIKSRGGRIGMKPISVGKIARVGFALDPDGNWIEISARTSLTGIPPK